MTPGRLRVAAATDRGRIREFNEDAYALRAEQGLFVVCDGMGGTAAGEVASRMAVETIVEYLTKAGGKAVAPLSAQERRYRPQTNRLAAAIRRSNEFIYHQARQDFRHAGMGTTVVCASIEQDIASVAHVGDSRAYLWRNHRLELLTVDHSLVEAQIRAGLIERGRSFESAHQNILLRALGCEPAVEADVNEVPLQPGDYLLLCSDGLTRMVPEGAMAQAIASWKDPKRICDGLIATANNNGGADNITVVVVKVVGGSWWRLWDHWKRMSSRGRDAEADSAA